MDPSFIIIIAAFAVLYYLILRPQQKRERERRELVRSLAEGDEVITNAGIHGVVVEVEADVVWLEVAPDVELKILRDAVTSRSSKTPREEPAESDAHADDRDADTSDSGKN